MPVTREPGFYWVELPEPKMLGQPFGTVVARAGEYAGEPAFWCDGWWFFESTVKVLNGRLEPPGEAKRLTLNECAHAMMDLAHRNGFVSKVNVYLPSAAPKSWRVKRPAAKAAPKKAAGRKTPRRRP